MVVSTVSTTGSHKFIWKQSINESPLPYRPPTCGSHVVHSLLPDTPEINRHRHTPIGSAPQYCTAIVPQCVNSETISFFARVLGVPALIRAPREPGGYPRAMPVRVARTLSCTPHPTFYMTAPSCLFSVRTFFAIRLYDTYFGL